MPSSALNSSTYTDLVDLGRRLYELSLVRRETEMITDPRGHPIGWLLDTRIPMLDGAIFNEVGEVLSDRLQSKSISQVAGFGFGAYSLVCSVLANSQDTNFKAGFIRGQRKGHGRRRLVEGPIERSQPVVLLDDILNSGRSAIKAINLLQKDGFKVAGVMTLFNFTWSGGRNRVENEGIWVDSLLDLNLRENSNVT